MMRSSQDQNASKMANVWALSLLLLLSGDVETNPGPKGRPEKDKGPSAEDKIRELGTALNEYEGKVQGRECPLKKVTNFLWLTVGNSHTTQSNLTKGTLPQPAAIALNPYLNP